MKTVLLVALLDCLGDDLVVSVSGVGGRSE